MDDVLFILRLPSAKDELMNGALCTLLAGSRLHLLLTKPEALNDGRKCLEEGESNQTDWKLLLCGQYVVQELNINHSNLGSERMGSKKAKQVNPSFTPEGWGTGGSDIYVCPMKIKGFHLFWP